MASEYNFESWWNKCYRDFNGKKIKNILVLTVLQKKEKKSSLYNVQIFKEVHPAQLKKKEIILQLLWLIDWFYF